MKKIIITGGSGFLGKNLGNYLNKQGKYKVFLCSRNIETLRRSAALTSCEFYPMDVNSEISIFDAFNFIQPEIVIHSAAAKFVDQAEKFPEECFQTNVLGSINLLRVCKIFKVSKLIAISTDRAANLDFNIYSQSKSIMENVLLTSAKNSKLKVSCLRFGNLCWSTGSVFNLWEEMTTKEKLVLSTGPNMRRFFMDVDEACFLIKLVMENINKCNGLIIIDIMKSAQIANILKVWSKIFKVNWKKIPSRKGDKLDEYLIAPNELKSAYKLKIKKRNLIAIDKNIQNKNVFKKGISSKNTKKLSNAEITNFIINKPILL